MKTFYVSLVRDLIHAYIAFEAESEKAVLQYLESEYYDHKTGVWKLPWCAVYEQLPVNRIETPDMQIIIPAKCGPLYEDQI